MLNRAELPMGTISETWEQYGKWAYTGRLLKSRQEKARNLALGLGVTGAVAAAATSIESLADRKTEIAMVSAGLIALAAYLGRELLSAEQQTQWGRCRILAEALKREVWRSLMQVPPYHGENAAKSLGEQAERLASNAGLETLDSGLNPPRRPLPQPRGAEDYISMRVGDQIGYYEDAAARHQKTLFRWKMVLLFLGAGAVLLGVLAGAFPKTPLWIPAVTTASTAILALVQSSRLQGLIPLYQETAFQLRLQKAAWNDREIQDKDTLVERCEAIMANENQSWRAEWLSKDAVESTNKKLSDVWRRAGDPVERHPNEES